MFSPLPTQGTKHRRVNPISETSLRGARPRRQTNTPTRYCYCGSTDLGAGLTFGPGPSRGRAESLLREQLLVRQDAQGLRNTHPVSACDTAAGEGTLSVSLKHVCEWRGGGVEWEWWGGGGGGGGQLRLSDLMFSATTNYHSRRVVAFGKWEADARASGEFNANT